MGGYYVTQPKLSVLSPFSSLKERVSVSAGLEVGDGGVEGFRVATGQPIKSVAYCRLSAGHEEWTLCVERSRMATGQCVHHIQYAQSVR